MKFIKKITRRWSMAGIICESDEDVYEYGIELFIFTIINISVILGSAVFIGRSLDGIALITVILPLQSFGGGYHAKTHLRCFLIMYIGWWVVVFLLPFITSIAAIFMSSAAMFIIFWLAPVANENVKMSFNQRLKMQKMVRIVAMVSLVSAFVFLFLQERVGIAMSTGLGIVSFSMLAAHWKNALEKASV